MNAFRPQASRLAAAAILSILAGASQAQSVPLNNPSFEGATLGSPWYDGSGSGYALVAGGAANLNKYLALTAGQSVNQSFTLGASGTYTVDFFAFGNGKSALLNSATFNAMDITEGSDPFNLARITTLADSPAHLPERFLIEDSLADWNHYSYTFDGVASASYHLYFVGVGPALFGVDRVGITAAVPEPESYAMMLAGLGALGFMARRRKQSQA